jgi:long-chain fatty acid transport protein
MLLLYAAAQQQTEVLLMKRWATMIAIAAICAVSAGELFAGSIDYLSNQSADYVRTFSRSASTDADAVIYNPAGTGMMKPGLYTQLSNQSILKTYQGTKAGTDYKSTEPSLLVPSLTALYKAESWAAFGGVSIVAGGGEVNFKDGIPSFSGAGTHSVKATSLFYGITAGGAYAITNWISASFGARYVIGEKTYKAHFASPTFGDLDASENAQGIGFIFGVDMKPIEGLLLAARFETATELKWKTTVDTQMNLSSQSPFIDGNKHRKDLPAMMSLGASYTLDKLTLTSSFDGFFIGMSDQKKDNTTGTAAERTYVDGYDDDYDSFGWEWSVSAEYAVIPEMLKLSAGYMYDKVGGNKDTYGDFDFSLDSQTVCLGGRFTAFQGLDLIFGFSRTFYKSDSDSNDTVKYSKSAYTIAYGAEYKM